MSGEFILQLDSAAAHRGLRLSTFLPITLPNVDQFLKILRKKNPVSSKLVRKQKSKVSLRLKHDATLPCDLSLISAMFQGVAGFLT